MPRMLYADKTGHETVYPLDKKIGLICTKDVRMRYTQRFSDLFARLVVEMPERRANEILEMLIGYKVGLASTPVIMSAIGEIYNAETDTGENVTAGDRDGHPGGGIGFLAETMAQINGHKDKDKIIPAAVMKADNPVESAKNNNKASLTAHYICCDGTGVPGIKKELEGVKGRQCDGSAKTFEAKLGVSFKQDFDRNGKPLLKNGEIFRREGDTKYIGTVEKVEEFGSMLNHFAKSNGIERSDQAVFIGDGATWIWNLQKKYFPDAIAIVDKYHAIENLNKIIDLLRFNKKHIREAFRGTCQWLLSLGKIEELDACVMGKAINANREKVSKKLEYFRKNKERMRYGLFTAAGLFVGSGVVEAACKTIVCSRLKRAGSHWSKKGAAAVIAIRCAIQSNEFNKHLPQDCSRTA